jgi:predicted XRE-type DNA-binding protein
MGRRVAKHVLIEPSSGNVFADLRLADATELGTKVGLAVQINRLIKVRQLTQATAAECLEVGQPTISDLKNYKLDEFSVARLMIFLLGLGQDVEIRITPRCAARAPGRIVVQTT